LKIKAVYNIYYHKALKNQKRKSKNSHNFKTNTFIGGWTFVNVTVTGTYKTIVSNVIVIIICLAMAYLVIILLK